MFIDKLTEDSIFKINELILKTYCHALDFVKNERLECDMLDVLKPSDKMIIRVSDVNNHILDDSIFETYKNFMFGWIKRINEHSNVMIPLGIHADAMKIYRLMLDTFFAKYQYREVIKFQGREFIFTVDDMVFNLYKRIINLCENEDLDYITYGLLTSSNKPCIDPTMIGSNIFTCPNVHTYRNAMLDWVKCIDEHSDVTIPLGIHADAMKIYKYMINTLFIREGFAEDIAAAAFSPRRMQYIIDTYGYDAMLGM